MIQKGAGLLFDGWDVTWNEKSSDGKSTKTLSKKIKCVSAIQDVQDDETECSICINSISSPIGGEFKEFPIAIFPKSCETTVMKRLINFGAAPTLEKISAACATFFAWAPNKDQTLLPRLFYSSDQKLTEQICGACDSGEFLGDFENLKILKKNIEKASDTLIKSGFYSYTYSISARSRLQKHVV